VSPGTLEDDLLRRDFSINSMALEVVSGELHDPTGGQGDLKSKVVRVLHDGSFIDDPTRIYRAVRLAARLDFALDPHTEELMRAAISSKALNTVSKERLWRELSLAFEEANTPRAIEALNNAGALDVLFDRRQID